MKCFLPIILCVLIGLSLLICEGRPSKKSSETLPPSRQDTSALNRVIVQKRFAPVHPSDGRFDEIARFIAGMAPDSLDPFPVLSNTEAWEKYHKTTDSKWNRFEKNHLRPIRQFAEVEFGEAGKSKEIFYPFSGPDFLYVTTLFPNAGRYILFGLEPVGRIPELQKMPADSLGGFLNAIHQSLDDVLSISFFKTKDMRLELEEGRLQGNMPVLMYLMVRTGNRILNTKPIRIDTSGNIAYADSFYTAPKGYYNHGVEIGFHRNGSKNVQHLIYFSVDISDYGLRGNKNARRFFQKLDTSLTTYVKAASYLMHKRYFARIRQTILSKSRMILQDDSGIPYRLFDPAVWNITLYGNYTQPIDMFKEYVEEDLKSAYGHGAKPLGFHLGYSAQSNLLFAVRKKP